MGELYVELREIIEDIRVLILMFLGVEWLNVVVVIFFCCKNFYE